MPNYLLVSDLLGFSKIVSNLNHDELSERIDEWKNVIRCVSSKSGIAKFQLISDTLFVLEEDSEEGLQSILQFSRSLLEIGIKHSFPLRGGIAYGDVNWGELTYGKPVIQAHELERSQDWIGITCTPDLPRIDSFWNWESIVAYPVPKKSGRIQIHPVIVWNIPEAKKLMQNTTGKGFYNEKEYIPWEAHRKAINTIIFQKYLNQTRLKSSDPKRFSYASPIHFLDTL